MEIKLNQVDDPIDYVLKVLRRQSLLLEVLQTNPRDSVATVYAQNNAIIDECHRDVNVAWNGLRQAVIEVGNGKMDVDEQHKLLITSINHGVIVCQKVCDLTDTLCDQYAIPENDPFLFAKIGTLLQP